MRNKVFILFLLIVNLENVFSQSSIINFENDYELNEYLRIFKSIHDDNIKEQEKILSYEDLPGTFWVMDEPIVINGLNHYGYGHFFLEDNWMLAVSVIDQTPIVTYKDDAIQFPYRSFVLVPPFRALKYEIINEKIIFNEEVFAYLEGTYVYFYSIINDKLEEGFKKFRLKSSFSIHDFTKE